MAAVGGCTSTCSGVDREPVRGGLMPQVRNLLGVDLACGSGWTGWTGFILATPVPVLRSRANAKKQIDQKPMKDSNIHAVPCLAGHSTPGAIRTVYTERAAHCVFAGRGHGHPRPQGKELVQHHFFRRH